MVDNEAPKILQLLTRTVVTGDDQFGAIPSWGRSSLSRSHGYVGFACSPELFPLSVNWADDVIHLEPQVPLLPWYKIIKVTFSQDIVDVLVNDGPHIQWWSHRVQRSWKMPTTCWYSTAPHSCVCWGCISKPTAPPGITT